MFVGPFLPGYEKYTGFESRDEVSSIMSHCVNYGASDVKMKVGERVLAYVRGNLYAASSKRLSSHDMDRVAVWMASDSMRLKLAGGESADRSVTIKDPERRDETGEPLEHRFRTNFHACEYQGDIGFDMTMRHIPAVPPTVEELGIEQHIIENSIPRQGLVICVGETGSGKSTSFAAFVRRIIEMGRNDPRAVRGPILTFEDPIEFSYERLQSQNVVVSQHEIDVHTASFGEGVKRALRRSPRLVVVGELRDFETIDTTMELITTGCPVYTTTHARDVANVIYRLVMKYPVEYQEQAFNAIVPRLHMLMAQTLVIRKDFQEDFRSTVDIVADAKETAVDDGGEERSFDDYEREAQAQHRVGRVCLREWIVLNESLKYDILRAGITGAEGVIRSACSADLYGRSMVTTVRMAIRDNLITPEAGREVLYSFGYTKQAEGLIDAAA